ncbi:MAG TPA: hypothetical protein VGD17_02985 [Chitinophagaceae bacterium]
MKSLFFILFVVAMSTISFAQQKNLVTVNTVKPKNGQKMAFEAAYKAHVTKFHKGDQSIAVYEILTGPYEGHYHLVGPMSAYEDFDKERSDDATHSLDLDKTFFPHLESTMNGTFRLLDSLSVHQQVQAEKFVVTVRHLKEGANQGNLRRELSRSAKVINEMKTKFFENLSLSVFEQLWDGSDQVVVEIRNLGDGFKSLEPNYYGATPAGSPSFRDVYSKMYGNSEWDTRVKDMEGMYGKVEVYLMRLRKDMSTPPPPAK